MALFTGKRVSAAFCFCTEVGTAAGLAAILRYYTVSQLGTPLYESSPS
jgi:hypothetical protein